MSRCKKLQIATTFIFIGALFLNLLSPVSAFTHPTTPPFPNRPLFPTMPQLDMEKNNPAVEIIFPEDQLFVDRSQPLEVNVHYKAQSIVTTVGDRQRTSYMRRIQAAELLLNGESFEVKQLKPWQGREGEVTFDVSFDFLPEDAEHVGLQARIYELYVPPRRHFRWRNRSVAESELVTVLFKSGQVVGPEGGIAEGIGGAKVTIPEGAVTEPVVVESESSSLGSIMLPLAEEIDYVGGIYFTTTPDVVFKKPVDISIPIEGSLSNDAQYFVVEYTKIGNQGGLQLLDVAEHEGNELASKFVFIPFPFFMITKPGEYHFVKPREEAGFVKGTVKREDGSLVEGAAVTINRMPSFLSKTTEAGEYQLPAPVGKTFAVIAFDPATGDFKSVGGALSEKGEGITIDIVLKPSSLPVNSMLTNGGFEDGLNGWTAKGRVEVVGSLGSITPREGNNMALISTGEGSLGEASSVLEQKFTIPPNAKKLIFEHRFVSEEFPEWVDTEFNDTFQVTLTTSEQTQEVAFESVNTSETTPIEGIDFPGGDNTTEATEWKTAEIDLTQLNSPGELTMTVTDFGDTIYDSAGLIDNVYISYEASKHDKFLYFPLKQSGDSSSTTPVNSVMDHHNPDFRSYYKSNKVRAFNKELAHGDQYFTPANFMYGNSLYSLKRNEDNQGEAISGINYVFSGGVYLSYDGHPGYDYKKGAGVDVYAAADGFAVNGSYSVGELLIKHSNDYVTSYQHLQPRLLDSTELINNLLQKGRNCQKDSNGKYISCEVKGNMDVIGKVGSKGADGPHLHFEVRYEPPGKQRRWLDPYGWVPNTFGLLIEDLRTISSPLLWLD